MLSPITIAVAKINVVHVYASEMKVTGPYTVQISPMMLIGV